MDTLEQQDAFRGLADPSRRDILELLAAGALPVREIAGHFPVSRPAISKHLRILRESGLVVEARSGRERIYELAPGALDGVKAWVEGLGEGAREAPATRSEPTTATRSEPATATGSKPAAPARGRPRRIARTEPRPRPSKPRRRPRPVAAPDSDWRAW